MIEQAADDRERAYLINHEIDGIRATIVRQTMFAEFEKITHELAEAGEALTVKAFQDAYRKLLADYFGPEFVLDEELELEWFPHSALLPRVLRVQVRHGTCRRDRAQRTRAARRAQELGDYLGFLKAGRSKYPLELLKDAGVDMSQPAPVDTALTRFSELVDELDSLL